MFLTTEIHAKCDVCGALEPIIKTSPGQPIPTMTWLRSEIQERGWLVARNGRIACPDCRKPKRAK